MISSLFDYSIFFMVVENDLAGHTCGDGGEESLADDGI